MLCLLFSQGLGSTPGSLGGGLRMITVQRIAVQSKVTVSYTSYTIISTIVYYCVITKFNISLINIALLLYALLYI